MKHLEDALYMEELWLVLEKEYARWLNIPLDVFQAYVDAIHSLPPSIDPILQRLSAPEMKAKKVLDKPILFCYRIVEKAYHFPVHESMSIDWVDFSYLPAERFVLYEACGNFVRSSYWYGIRHLFEADEEDLPP